MCSMTSYSRSKINNLVTGSSRGAVLTTTYLRGLGLSYELIRFYEKTAWLDSLGYGAYKLHNDQVGWVGALCAMREQLKLHIHIGGKSALELQGYGHFVGPSMRNLFLFGENQEKLPLWFTKYHWGIGVQYSRASLFSSPVEGSLTTHEKNGLSVAMASPERAIMEMLNFVPKKQSFSEATLIFESLTALRPQLVQSLLEACTSIKVKRIFLWMAEKNNYPWFRKLDTAKVALGAGNRVVVEGGVLDTKYLITVPHDDPTHR
ncbi:MAG: hypothetical protein A4E57_03989 [Syntrophorhabdaceae bacterium PtaU1.Bin034]|nr:MAG: hypothetical protein A4E57_03989 [Syntrophorhabdaceae bacterium PtaU1.Bin034]